jgi:hypothetical protein
MKETSESSSFEKYSWKRKKRKRFTRTWQGFEGRVMNFLECINLHEYQAFLTLVCGWLQFKVWNDVVWFLTFMKNSGSNCKKSTRIVSVRVPHINGMWKLDWIWFYYTNVSSRCSFENQFRFGQIQFVQTKTEMDTILSYSPKWVPTQH